MFISDETVRTIHLVARHRNITIAAEQLNKVPSTISYILKRAEETPGVRLFIHKGRYTELSPARSYFIRHSKNILRDPDALKCNTVLVRDGIKRELTIAVNSVIPGDFLVSFIQDFERQFTSTTLAVDIEVYNGCWNALCSKHAGLVYSAPRAVPGSGGTISEPVGQIEWDFVVSPLYPLAVKRSPLENNESRHYPVVCTRDTSVSFPPMQAWLLEGQKPILAPDFAMAISLIEQNVGIGHIPHHLALPLLNRGKLPKEPMCEHEHATKLFLVARSGDIGRACLWCMSYLGNKQFMA